MGRAFRPDLACRARFAGGSFVGTGVSWRGWISISPRRPSSSDALRHRTISSRELLDHLLATGRGAQSPPERHRGPRRRPGPGRRRRRRRRDGPRRGRVGPLHGLPMTVKDVWETEGLVTTSGAPELRDHVPEADALAVARLKAAGAIIFGKTNTPLYAGDFQTFNDVYGATNNPWDTTRTAGGSSGGAADRRGRRAHAARARQRHRRLDPQPGPLQRRLRAEAIVGRRAQPGPHSRAAGEPGRGRRQLQRALGPQPRGSAPGPRRRGRPRPRGRRRLAPRARRGTAARRRRGSAGGHRLRRRERSAAGWRATSTPGSTAFAEPVWPTPAPGSTPSPFRCRSPTASGRGRSWSAPSSGPVLPDDVFAAFAGLEDIPGDDPVLTAGRALDSRYRTWARANALRQHQRCRLGRAASSTTTSSSPR